MKKLLLLLASLGIPVLALGQTPAPVPVQHFVISTMAGNYGGNAVSIASTGTQLYQGANKAVSVSYEYISNPDDPTQTRVGSGVANYTFQASSIFPASFRSKLLIDLTNYNITLQAGGGVESIFKGAGNARAQHVVGDFGIFGSYPLPGGHTQIGLGAKYIVGPQGGLVKVPVGQLNFTF